MTPPPPFYHALLRPAVLQILRATGYHSAKTSVLDAVTDLAARYLLHLCQLTALYATHNNNNNNNDGDDGDDGDDNAEDDIEEGQPLSIAGGGSGSGPGGSGGPSPSSHYGVPAPTVVDVRMALQRAGALQPERLAGEQEYLGAEDTRGVEAIVAWARGPLNREIRRIALDGGDEGRDYLDALKKKHSKNDDDSKHRGTLLGRPIEHGDVPLEGGECPSILVWEERRRIAGQKTPAPQQQGQRRAGGPEINGDGDGDGDGDVDELRPPSSGLSSLDDRSVVDNMDLT